MVPRSGGMLPSGARVPLPSRLSEADLDIYAGKFARSGFRGPLNYYRNVDRNWELMAAFEGIKVGVPALYAGDHDLVIAFPGAAEHIANMKQHVPHLRDVQMLPGCAIGPSKSAHRSQRRDYRIFAKSTILKMSPANR